MNAKKAKKLRALLDYESEVKESSLPRKTQIKMMRVIVPSPVGGGLLLTRLMDVRITATLKYEEDSVRRAYKNAKKGLKNAE